LTTERQAAESLLDLVSFGFIATASLHGS
jgi:hypothetical protein